MDSNMEEKLRGQFSGTARLKIMQKTNLFLRVPGDLLKELPPPDAPAPGKARKARGIEGQGEPMKAKEG
jgi:hypothetical protein